MLAEILAGEKGSLVKGSELRNSSGGVAIEVRSIEVGRAKLGASIDSISTSIVLPLGGLVPGEGFGGSEDNSIEPGLLAVQRVYNTR
jgi:hypothetical protein